MVVAGGVDLPRQCPWGVIRPDHVLKSLVSVANATTETGTRAGVGELLDGPPISISRQNIFLNKFYSTPFIPLVRGNPHPSSPLHNLNYGEGWMLQQTG